MRRRTGFTLAELLVFMALAASVAGIYAGFVRITRPQIWAVQAVMSADGSTAAVLFDDQSIRVWDTKTLRLATEIAAHDDEEITSLCLSPHGDALIYHFRDSMKRRRVVLTDLVTNRATEIGQWNGEPNFSTFPPRGDKIATFVIRSPASEVVQWSPTETDKQVAYSGIIGGRGYGPGRIAFSPDGSSLAIGCLNGEVRSQSTEGGDVRTIADVQGTPENLTFSADGRRLAATVHSWSILTPARQAIVWDYASGQVLMKLDLAIVYSNSAPAAFLPDGRLVVENGNEVHIYDTDDEKGTVLFGANNGVTCLAIAPQANHFVVGSGSSVELWNAKTLNPEQTLYDPTPDPTLLLVSFPLAVLALTFLVILLVRRRARRCLECGKRFSPWRNKNAAGEIVCPHCAAPFNPQQAKPRTRAKNLRGFIVSVLTCGCLCGFIASDHFGWPIYLTVPAGLGLAFAALLGIGFFMLWLQRRFARIGCNMARKVAGGQGKIVRVDSLLIWTAEHAGDGEPLAQQYIICRRQFETWTGPLRTEPRLRVLCFARHEHFSAYLRQYYRFPMEEITGIYLGTLHASIVMCDDERATSSRIERTLFVFRATVGHYFYRAPGCDYRVYWLVNALGANLAVFDEPGEWARVQRKLRAADARNRLIGADLLRISPQDYVKQYFSQGSDESHLARSIFVSQCWSLGHYLFGAGATDARRETFRAFVQDLTKREDHAVTFARHFGYGYDQLYADWKAWMLAQPDAPHEPPPAEIHDAIVNRLVPVIRDPSAPLEERRKLIRRLGSGGYLIGADALIDLLRPANAAENPAARLAELRQPAIDALEFISGQTFGEEVARWDMWWAEVNHT